MKGLNLVVLIVMIAVIGYLVFKDRLKFPLAKVEEATDTTMSTWEAALMSALQDLRIRL